MHPTYNNPSELRETLHWLLSISATLAGFCVTAIGLLNTNNTMVQYAGLGDNVLGVAGVFFLLSTYLSFWALRTRTHERRVILARFIDAFFLFGLTLVVISGIGIAYSLF